MQPGSGSQPIPEQVTNALASLRPSDTEVYVAGEWVLVPAQTAADWLELLMGDLEPAVIFPGLCDAEDQEWVDDCLRDGVISVPEVERITLNLIEAVSGKPWWITLRMINIAERKWGVVGTDLLRQGIDATRMSLAAWLDVLWVTIFGHLEPEKWTMLALQLEAPPPEETSRSSIDTMEMSEDSFTSLMQG